jgi:hypothetical protein
MSDLRGYFDLNKRLADAERTRTLPEYTFVPPPDGASVFAVQSNKAKVLMPAWKQFALYLGTGIGVLFSSSIIQFQAGRVGALNITIATVLLAALIALVIMPNIYEKAVKHEAPFIVQLGLFVQQGVFWSVLLSAIGKVLV